MFCKECYRDTDPDQGYDQYPGMVLCRSSNRGRLGEVKN